MKHDDPSSAAETTDRDAQALVRDLRIRIGLLQTELEQVRREHAALKAGITQDIALLARRYLEPGKHASGVRTVDGVIFGGWDHLDSRSERESDSPNESTVPRDSRSA